MTALPTRHSLLNAALTARAASLTIIMLTTASCGALPAKIIEGHPTAASRSEASPTTPPPPKMEGSYRVIAGPAGTPAVTWVFTACGDGCAEVEMGAAGSQQQATARYVQMNWTIDQHSVGALTCGDGTQVPGTAHYSWNPDTLQGRYWSTSDSSQPCGYGQSLDTYLVPLTLTKADS